ncbi:MAG: TolC family protein [Chlamydiia bacterium]|nr:TolC family protein [Chlamydiia bacterium]
MIFLLSIFSAVAANPCCSFDRLTLAQAENFALERNYNLQQMSQLVMKARAGRLEAISKWFPQVELMSVGFKTEREEVFTGTHSAFLSQFNISQAVLSTERFYGVRISTLIQEQLCRLYEALKIDVLFEVRKLYTLLILDSLNLKTARENVRIFEELALQQQRQLQIGTTIQLNFNQSLVAVTQALEKYYQAESRYKKTVDGLVRAMGFEPGNVALTLADEVIPIDSVPEVRSKVDRVRQVFAGGDNLYKQGFPATLKMEMDRLFSCEEIGWWQAVALFYQPTLKVKQVDVGIAKQYELKARGEFLPRVMLEANYGGNPTNMLNQPSGSFGNQNMDWAVGYRIDWLLFDSFGRDMRMRQAFWETKAQQSGLQEQVLVT